MCLCCTPLKRGPAHQVEAADSADIRNRLGVRLVYSDPRKKGMEAGATKDAIIETCFVAMVMGDGPALAYAKVALDAVKEFSAA